MTGDEEFKKDLAGIQSRLMSPSMGPEWKQLKEKISTFMNESRRTWGSAIFYLLEKGLEYESYRRTDR